jgi:hypothetical protein
MIVMNDRYGTMIPKLTSEDPIVGLGLSDEKLGKIATAQCEIIGYTKFENDAGSIVDFSCPKDWNVPGSDL